MKGVHQTIFDEVRGNCNAACFASILEVPIEAIPDEPASPWERRAELLNRYLNSRGLYQLFLRDLEAPIPGYCVATIKSPRFDIGHAVVCLEGQIVWDPFPGGVAHYGFDYSKTFDHTVLVPIDPGSITRDENRLRDLVRANAELQQEVRPC